MFAPTKTWRKWHRKINTNQKRYAGASALVMARGHRVENVAEVPCVVATEVESIKKTKKAIEVLKAIGAYDDCEKAANSKKLRRGKGKMRNRRYVQRRGPLVVYANDDGLTKAFRNLPGVELAQVEALNLSKLHTGKVAEGLSQTIVVSVDNERTATLDVTAVTHLTLTT